MRQDIRNRRKTEIDSINGYMVKIAQKHHIELPVNQSITHLIQGIEQRYLSPPPIDSALNLCQENASLEKTTD
jgi:ketopantoate reductase